MLSLQEISDRLELQQLVVEYAGAIDRREFERLDRVFTPDAYIDYRAFGGIDGSYAVVKPWLSEALKRFAAYQHLVANAEFRIEGDSASGRILCVNPVVFNLLANATQVGFYGLWYVDSYVRAPAGWRIARRSEQKCFEHNLPAPDGI